MRPLSKAWDVLFVPLLADQFHWQVHIPWLYPVWGAGIFAYVNLNIWRFFAALAARKPGKSELCPEGVDGYNIELAIVGGDPYRAMDRGVAWFEDGLLHFNGETTSFVLAPEDLIAQPFFQLSREHGVARDAIFLNLRNKWAYIRLLPLLGLRGLRFRMELRRFLKSTGPIGKSRQWPPLSRQPAVAAPEFGTAEAIGAAAAETGRAQGVLKA